MANQANIHEISNEKLRVRASAKGAELWSICTPDGVEYLWQGDPAFWSDRSPTIFPYVARLTEGAYTYGGQRYALPIHGFAPGSVFRAENVSSEAMRFVLESNEETLKVYPFDFQFTVAYRLEDTSLIVEYIVENRGDGPMYFGAGVHPGFNVPMEPGIPFESYRITFDKTCTPQRVSFTPDCFVTGETTPFSLEDGQKIPLRHDLFDDDAVILKDMSRSLTLHSPLGQRAVTFEFLDYPIFGLWHWPRKEAPYICLEAWSSLPSRNGVVEDLAQQADLVCLPSGAEWRNSVRLTIH